MPIAPLLQRFIDDELERSGTLIARVLAGTLQLFGRSRDAGTSATERTLHADLVATLHRDPGRFEQAFLDSLHARVADDVQDLRETSPGGPTSVPGGLQLMDESAVDVDIEISRAMQLIDTTAEWELRELQTFTSTLIGQAHVSAESNPFRPLTYATALWDAACAVTPSAALRATLLRTSAGVVAGLLKNAWAAASTRLEAQGVEPGLYRTLVLPSSPAFGRSSPVAESPKPGALAALLASMPATSLHEFARNGRSSSPTASAMPAPFDRFAARPMRSPAMEQALLRLEALLRFALSARPADAAPFPGTFELSGIGPEFTQGLAQHRAAVLASSGEARERQVLELVGRLFDSMLSDSQLTVACRVVIARLQVAALRIALIDSTILESYEHPVWNLLDRIAATGMAYPRGNDPRQSALLALCETVAGEIASAGSSDAAPFRQGLRRIDLFLSAQLKEQANEAQTTIDALEIAERREQLEQHMVLRLTDQMVPVRTTPAIRRFVTGTWARVIAVDMLQSGEQSEAVLGDLKTIDDLLWSLKIPDHPQSRQRLVALLPGLLQRIRSGMEAVQVAPKEQQAVLNDLMVVHTEGLRPGSRSHVGALTPEEIVKRMREEVVPESLGPRPFSDSVIDLSSMDTVPAEVLPSRTAGDEETGRRVDALRAGDRQRMFVNGRWSHVQMLWSSARGTFLLFAGELPGRHHSITRRALERLASAGLLQPHDPKPLVQRATDRMLRDLAQRQ